MSSSDEEEKRPKQPELSFITPNGYQRNSCGYCKSENGSVSYYASSKCMRVEEYQEMLDRGWRRSGSLYYKQNLKRSCCPHYTIRLDPTTFKPRKDQRLAMNHWNNFVLGQSYIRSAARLCPKTREEKKLRKSKFDLLQRVHEVEYTNVKKLRDPKTKRAIEPAHRFEVNIEYDLFLKYQMTIHKEPASRWNVPSFKRFLCTGIQRKTVKIGSKEQRLGSYHQCYRLDGKLIAVAVLDLLPHAVSSVYLFYDPEYSDYEFGKISALREIALTSEGNYQYYYMGFYIHSCPKMRYKANFQPQYVLDPESFTWSPFDNYKYELDRRPYMSLSHDSTLEATTKAGGGVEAHPSDEEKEASNVIPPIGEEDMSLFDVHMPGVLTLQQLEEQVDLDHWKLLAHGVLVDMVDLVPWDNSDIRNPQSIKGIVAELAAVLGPTVVENSVVVLF
ncbi:arginine-tRNA-protein transferase [Histoplasma capsulatum]|uniref:arginyltransferase n=1 Tax=Ajellomyces capsulatus TaxID=5037 RepID=A0A8A1MJV5_AJECA|nr:arginine-tRNA-protein transferase [Histoplasma capsulatum]